MAYLWLNSKYSNTTSIIMRQTPFTEQSVIRSKYVYDMAQIQHALIVCDKAQIQHALTVCDMAQIRVTWLRSSTLSHKISNVEK